MNVKAQAIDTDAGKSTDTVLLTVAVLLVIAGVVAYYLLPRSVPSLVHAACVVGGIILALAVTWFTKLGRATREYIHETQFEMRKVVWPTREETVRTTLVVAVVTALIAIVLGLIDVVLKWVIIDHVLPLKW